MQSSEPKERTPEQKAKWAAYIRQYRKNRRIKEKLAAGEVIAIGNSPVSPDGGSSIPDTTTQGA